MTTRFDHFIGRSLLWTSIVVAFAHAMSATAEDSTLFKAEPVPETIPQMVRIGFYLTPYKKGTSVDKNGHKTAKIEPQQTLKYTLRAKLTKPNHFFIADYHIVTTPEYWTRRSNQYGVKIAIMQKFGDLGSVEEELGNFKLEGKLEGRDPLYVLHGMAEKQFVDKLGSPILNISAGYQEDAEKKAKLTKTPTKKTTTVSKNLKPEPKPGGKDLQNFAE